MAAAVAAGTILEVFEQIFVVGQAVVVGGAVALESNLVAAAVERFAGAVVVVLGE